MGTTSGRPPAVRRNLAPNLGQAWSILAIGAALLAPTTASAASLRLAFTANQARATGWYSLHGCRVEPGSANGGIGAAVSGATCHAGKLGDAAGGEITNPAEFTSAPFRGGLELQGPVFINIYYYDTGPYVDGSIGRMMYLLEELDPAGVATKISSGTAIDEIYYGNAYGTFKVPRYTVEPGNRLRLRLGNISTTSKGDFLFGGASGQFNDLDYGDAGITISVGSDDGSGAGSLPLITVLLLLAGAAVRSGFRPVPGKIPDFCKDSRAPPR